MLFEILLRVIDKVRCINIGQHNTHSCLCRIGRKLQKFLDMVSIVKRSMLISVTNLLLKEEIFAS